MDYQMTKKTTETLNRREVAGLAAVAAALAATPAMANQPNMESALGALHTAKRELEASKHNKGGHRVKALEYVQAAIDQVKAGIDYAG